MQISYHPAAGREIVQEVRYYDNRSPGLGRDFKEGVRQAMQKIQATPLRFAPGAFGTRRCPIGRFPHRIVYRVENDLLLVYAVAHPKRKPDYWMERVTGGLD